MAVPTVITDLNVSAGSNGPGDTEQVFPENDNFLRAIQAILRRSQAKGTNLASAGTVSIGTSTTGDYIHITGTSTITAFDTIDAGIIRVLCFDGALTITHNATTLIMPDAINYKTQAGDVLAFISEGSGNWRCLYQSRKQTIIDMSSASANITLPVGYSALYNFSGVSSQALYLNCTNDQRYEVYLDFNFSSATASAGIRINSAARTTGYILAFNVNSGASVSSSSASGDLNIAYSYARPNRVEVSFKNSEPRSSYTATYSDGSTYGAVTAWYSQSVLPTEMTSLVPTAGTITGSLVIRRVL